MLRSSTFIAAIALAISTVTIVQAAPADTAWTTYRDPHGFTVSIPTGWPVRFDAQKTSALITGDDLAIAIRPAFWKPSVDGTAAVALTQSLARDTDGGFTWSAPQQVADHVAKLTGISANRHAVAYVSWRSAPHGTAFYLYEASAPASTLDAAASTYARIFGSFRIVPPDATPAQAPPNAMPALAYATYRDPSEGAFTVELPRGWNAKLALNRVSALDVRPSWKATSPDGIEIASGDSTLSGFTVPTAYLRMAGIGAGQTYHPGPGVSLVVEPYTQGLAFAQAYVRQRLARTCSGTTIVKTRDLTPSMGPVDSAYRTSGFNLRTTAGDVSFTCNRNGTPMRGYLFAATQLVSAQTNAMWVVSNLVGYVAAAAASQEAAVALNRATGTFRWDPQWAQRAGAQAMAIAKATEQSQNAIARSIASRSQSMAQNHPLTSSVSGMNTDIYDGFDEAVRGVQTVENPTYGTTRQIDNTYEYNYIGPGNVIVGSHVDASPGINFQQLIPVKPGS